MINGKDKILLMAIIINYTPTGMLPNKKMTPHVPISPDEIIEDVYNAWNLGISMVHLHARDWQTGEPTYKSEIYAEIISGIRKFTKDLIICVSLSGRNFKTFEERSEALNLEGELKPDMGSLTLSSLNFNNQESINSPEMIQSLAKKMIEKGIVPELEVFDIGMLNYAKYLEKKKLICPPFYFNLLFGNIASAQADLLHLGILTRDLPANSYWSLGGLGSNQLLLNIIGIAFKSGIRIGLEDNLWLDENKTILATNFQLLTRIHEILKILDLNYLNPSFLREKLKMLPGKGLYGRNYF